MTQFNELAIAALILERSHALALTRSGLVRRAGFKNVAKGLRRLDELCAGELKSTASLIAGFYPQRWRCRQRRLRMRSDRPNNKLPRRDALPNKKRRQLGGHDSGPAPTS